MGFFKLDGLFYKTVSFIFNLLLLNLLWFIFSLPLFTIGPSTTALFYVAGKIIRQEQPELVKDFWHSFKLNFRQASIIQLILLFAYLIIWTNLSNTHLFTGIFRLFIPLQIFLLLELVIITLYIFPLLARYEVTIVNALKAAWWLAHRHLISTFLALLVIPGMLYLFYWQGIFLFFAGAIYACWVSGILKRVFAQDLNQLLQS